MEFSMLKHFRDLDGHNIYLFWILKAFLIIEYVVWPTVNVIADETYKFFSLKFTNSHSLLYFAR